MPPLLRLLGDETRLRLLRLLSREALNVSELTGRPGRRAVGRVPASRPAARRRAGRRGTRRARSAGTGCRTRSTNGDRRRAAPLWAWLARGVQRATRRTRAPTTRGWRKCGGCGKESFSQHGDGDERRQLVPGRSWAAWSRALGLLLPAVDVADLGCGEGYLTIEAARWARRVIAVDRSRGRARARHARWRSAASSTNITWKRGDLERLPITDASIDIALLSQALHHAEHPDARARRGAPDSPARRPRARPRSARARRALGAARSSATAGSASATTQLRELLDARRVSSTSRARRRAPDAAIHSRC